jgi:hypothetical protein
MNKLIEVKDSMVTVATPLMEMLIDPRVTVSILIKDDAGKPLYFIRSVDGKIVESKADRARDMELKHD